MKPTQLPRFGAVAPPPQGERKHRNFCTIFFFWIQFSFITDCWTSDWIHHVFFHRHCFYSTIFVISGIFKHYLLANMVSTHPKKGAAKHGFFTVKVTNEPKPLMGTESSQVQVRHVLVVAGYVLIINLVPSMEIIQKKYLNPLSIWFCFVQFRLVT